MVFRPRSTAILIGALGLLALQPVRPLLAASIVVNTSADDTTAGDGFCTLREAVVNSNLDSDSTSNDCVAGSGLDSITFAGDYTITLGSTLPDIVDTDDLVITGNSPSKTIIQAAASPGTATYRIVKVNGGLVAATFNSLTLRHGVEASGGCINVVDGTLVLNGVTVSDNRATNVGATTGLNGGAISSNGNSTVVTNCTFSNNSVSTSDTGNSARGNGGAIFYSSGTLTVSNSTFTDNSASRAGGAIYATGAPAISVRFSTVANNTSDSDSDGTGDGGGVARNNGTFTLVSSIVAGNTKGVSSPTDNDCSGTIGSLGYNLTGSGTGCSLSGTGDLSVSPASVFTTVLGSLGSHGGSTSSYDLPAGSPALDVVPLGTNGCGTTPFDLDQRGMTRPANGSCDVGAFEDQVPTPTPTMTPTATATATPTTTPTTTATPTSTLPANCPSAPLEGCDIATSNSVKLVVGGDKPSFGWKWIKGVAAADGVDFGDPVAGTAGYRLCLYDESGGVVSLKMGAAWSSGGDCGGKPCWKGSAERGWSYKDKSGDADGITKVTFKPGAAGKPQIKISGAGASLPLPAPASGDKTLRQDLVVTLQLSLDGSGQCWASTFTTAKRNDGESFRAP